MLAASGIRQPLETAGRDDQRSLLSYYSAETTAHATNLLAIALVILTAIQILSDSTLRLFGQPLLLPFVLAVLFSMATWMVGKMTYWANLATAIMFVDATDRDHVVVTEATGAMALLHLAACQRLQNTLSAQFRAFSLRHLWGLWISIFVGISVLVVVFLGLSVNLP